MKATVAAAGTALLLGAAAMSHQQDPAAANAPFDSTANGGAVRSHAEGGPSAAQEKPSAPQEQPSEAQAAPREITVVATRYKFEPARIAVTEGERVRLVLTSGDGVHGVEIKKFNVNKKIPRGGDPVTIEFVAAAAGRYPILCSEYCGKGHDAMKGVLIVNVQP